eukprot:TRINITY_DN20423_c0_g2_i1.p1 TRINITY_DN20423_c0_g2~~TRINITY_DN20423_c0_g2_i1.p1  ORF type:complete len:102 (-),score=3.72 TRINITY_DN20423_c0_g2_i1:199-504(-)
MQRQRIIIIIINACPMCLADEETVDHLLLGCKTAYSIWIAALSWFGLSWTFLKTLLDHLNAWKLMSGATKGKQLWMTFFLATLWVIWRERNSRSMLVTIHR